MGVFIYDGEPAYEYTGQINDSKPHGKGVMTVSWGAELSGDWVNGLFSNYGELAQSRNDQEGTEMKLAQGQCAGGCQHGYGVEYSDAGKYQGQWVTGAKHGMVRHTSPDGVVSDTIWKDGDNTWTPCNADDVVERADLG